MSAVTRPRGPLPRRVYWTRRLLVLLVAGLLVVGIAHLWGGGSGRRPTASAVSGTPTAVASSSPPSSPAGTFATEAPGAAAGSEETSGPEPTSRPRGASRKPALVAPEGPCDPADVLITPRLPDPHAGEPVEVDLEVTTAKSPACTWQLSPETVFLTVDDESGQVWSSQQCPGAIPTQDVVPRRDRADVVRLTWDARRSDPGCTAAADWVLPGRYTATAVARGSVTPIDVGFRLGPPPRQGGPGRPAAGATATPNAGPRAAPTAGPTATPTAGSTGAQSAPGSAPADGTRPRR